MKVLKVEPAGTADVYNMEVEGTHDFAVGSGIIAHNCYDEMKYVLMENTIPMPKKVIVPPKQYDPLDPLDDYYRQSDYTDRYSFYQRY